MNIFPYLKMMASMGVDAEAEMEELFAQHEAEEAPGTQSLTQEEGIHYTPKVGLSSFNPYHSN